MKSTPNELALKRRIKTLEEELKQLVAATGSFIKRTDEIMSKPHSSEREKAIAQLVGHLLEYARDHARYFGLGVDFRHDPEKKAQQTCVLNTSGICAGPTPSSCDTSKCTRKAAK